MELEREIQKWLAKMAGKGKASGNGELYSAIRYDDSKLGQEMKDQVEGYGSRGGLAPDRHRAVHEACRVLNSFKEPRFRSADTNISTIPKKILKPDLILEDEISGALIIVELKRSASAAREFATELLAYTNSLKDQYPGSQIFLVLISTSLAPLEQHALAQLIDWHIPTLALEYKEACSPDYVPTLWVRADLLPLRSERTFLPKALIVDTKVFWLPYGWSKTTWVSKIRHAAQGVVREAERSWASGFLIIWWQEDEIPDWSRRAPQTRLFVSMAIRNPCRPQVRRKPRSGRQDLEYGWSNIHTELTDDTAIRLLSKFDLGPDIEAYPPEYEGIWDKLSARLCDDDALILSFDGFGEIGDTVNNWRTDKRYSLSPLIENFTELPAWHALTWLPALESLIDRAAKDEDDSVSWDAFRRGRDLACLLKEKFCRPHSRLFEWTLAQTRFSIALRNLIVEKRGLTSPNMRSVRDALRYNQSHIERAFAFGFRCAEQDGELAAFGFELGFRYEQDSGDYDDLANRCAALIKRGFRVPHELLLIARGELHPS
jgi:hypothetical protein